MPIPANPKLYQMAKQIADSKYDKPRQNTRALLLSYFIQVLIQMLSHF